MSEQDKVTLFGVVFSAIVVLSVLLVSAKDVIGWLKHRLTKRATDETNCTCKDGYGSVLDVGNCGHCGKPLASLERIVYVARKNKIP